MSKEVPFTAERENGNNRWTDVASVSIGCAVPMVVFGRASIVPFVALPIIIGLCRSDTAFFRMIQEAIRRHRFLVMAVAATILYWLISSVASIDPVKSLSTWARTAAILALGVMLTAFLSQSKRRVDLALKSLTISSFGLLLFYAVFSLYIHPAPFELFRLIKGPNAIALQTLKPYFSVSACILPIVVWAGFRLGSFHKLIALFSIPLTFLLIYGKGVQPGLSAAFGVVAAFLLVVFLLGLKFLPTYLARTLVLLIFCAAAASGIYLIDGLPTPPAAAIPSSELSFPDWHRQVIWGFTIEVIKSAPILGVGPNAINLLPGANELIPGMNQEYIPSHPHNWLLEIGAETGLVGLVLFVTSLLTALKTLAALAIRQSAAAWVATALFGAFWGSSLANFSIWSAWWLVVFAALLSLPLATMVRENKQIGASEMLPSC
jgi:O-antigen ligase